ncbi:MAG TPA: hypothetical protein VGC85_04975 [Chthoniobacterales bacterium]
MKHSLGRIRAIAGNSFIELSRMKAFYLLLLFALVLIGSSVFLARLSFEQELQVLKDVSLGAISLFTSVLAIVATARLLPEDVEDRTVYTILAKPVRRFEYIIGKLLGVLLLIALSTIIMAALFVAVLYVRQQHALAEASQQAAAADAIAAVRAASFHANLLWAVAMIFLKAAILAAITLFISTFATSTVFTIVVAVFVYFIGHLQSTAREFWLQEQPAGWLARIFLACVALVFPDLQLFDFTNQAVVGAAIPSFILAQSFLLGAFYLVIYTLLAIAIFGEKEL